VTTNIHGHEECTVHQEIIQNSFELSTILVFFIPMTLITVLYLLIGLKLRSRTVRRENGGANCRNLSSSFRKQTAQGTKRVLKMLGMEINYKVKFSISEIINSGIFIIKLFEKYFHKKKFTPFLANFYFLLFFKSFMLKL
jgi:hypothetical protein